MYLEKFLAGNFVKLVLAVVLAGFVVGVAAFGPTPTAYLLRGGEQVNADAGPDQSVMLGNPVILNGGNSKAEPGQKIVKYNWRIISPALEGPKEFSGVVYRFTPEKSGNYQAELTVITDKGARDRDTAFITVRARGQEGFSRKIYAKVANRYCTPNKECSIGWAAYAIEGTIKQYTIDFGDGQTETKEVSTKTLSTVSKHTYAKEGTYEFKLTVTSSTKEVVEATATIKVTTQLPAPIVRQPTNITPNNPPVANAGEDFSCTLGTACSFDATKSTDSDGKIITYTWSFGDGTSARGATATHTYSTAGKYLAILKVVDDKGAASTDSVVVTVTASNETPISTPVVSSGY